MDGFQLGKKQHIIAGTSVSQEDVFNSGKEDDYLLRVNNAFIILLSTDLKSSKIKWLTKFPLSKKKCIDCLKLIPAGSDRFIIIYGVRDYQKENEETFYQMIDSDGTVLKKGKIKKNFYCTSEPSYADGVITWCHYEDSQLGSFMIMNKWDIKTDKFSAKNLDLGIDSKIKRIERDGFFEESAYLQTAVQGSAHTLTCEVCTSISIDKLSDCTAPAIWTSSNPKVAEISCEDALLSQEVYNSHSKKHR